MRRALNFVICPNICHAGFSKNLGQLLADLMHSLMMQARQEQPLSAAGYSFENYLAYLLYPPLYIAGPLLSFRVFASQLKSPKKLASKEVQLPQWLILCIALGCFNLLI